MRTILLIVGLALLAAGPATLVAPSAAASAYGIRVESSDGQPYLVATAIRDVALGVWLLAMLMLGAPVRALAAAMFAIALVAAGDAVNVVVHAGAAGAVPVAIHGGACVVLLGLGLRLLKSVKVEDVRKATG